MTLPAPTRLNAVDVLRVGVVGMRTRPLRATLSALGIAIGIAAMVAVVGISDSSRQSLIDQLNALGTNLLRVAPGQDVFGNQIELPDSAVAMVRRIGPVQTVSATGLTDADVFRSDRVSPDETGGLSVVASRLDLLGTIGGRLHAGAFLNTATQRYPSVVLGAVAAQRLGIDRPDGQVWLGNRWFTVVGILDEVPLAPEIDRTALVGWSAAHTYLGFDGHPTTIYERSTEDSVTDVQNVLAQTAYPQDPTSVEVSRPSDALAARTAAKDTYTALFLGLGAVALLVGAIGVANTMVISVLERRREIGLRRAIGASRGQIRLQFLTESVLLSAFGGGFGALLGIAGTTAYAASQGWPSVLPVAAVVGGIGASVVVGAVAGMYPAVRASRLTPTAALASP